MELSEAIAKDLVPTIAVTMGCSIAIILPCVYMWTSSWRKVRTFEQNAVLKKAMIDKGMSAEDITNVLNAGNHDQIWENEEAVKTMNRMIKNGYSAADIAKVMRDGPAAAAKVG